jgi:P-type Ca2+ transporter type 2C
MMTPNLPGTLTQNEQTVVELYVVDEVTKIDPHSTSPQAKRLSPAMARTLEIGSICNNATRHEDGQYVGQATDVALLNVLSQFEMSDQRQVCV